MTFKGRYLGQHVLLISICGVFLAVLAAVLLIPAHQKIEELDRRILRTQDQVDQQKILYPLYTQLMSELGRLQNRDLPEPRRIAFNQDEIEHLWDIFGDLAAESGLETVSIQPVSETVSDQLQVNGVFAGELPALRRFLLELGTLSFVSHVEQILVQEVVGGREYRLRMWLRIG